MIFVKNQSNIIANILNNVFLIIIINKNYNIGIYQKNIAFNIKKSIFKNHVLKI